MTHVLGKPKPNDNTEVLRWDQLCRASNKSELLLVILLLKNLGLPFELILQRLKNCQRFDLRPFRGLDVDHRAAGGEVGGRRIFGGMA